MRVKHTLFGGKGEVFRKEFCQLSSSETDSGEEAIETVQIEEKETHDKRKKHKRRRKDIHPKHISEKSQKGKHQRKEESETKPNNQELSGIPLNCTSAISKNRITRSIGIYNKSKRSTTVLQETIKQRLSTKGLAIKETTKKDLAKVLDCSSFNLGSSATGPLTGTLASPQSHSGSSNHLNNSAHSLPLLNTAPSSARSMVKLSSAKAARKEDLPSERKRLAFKTPLQEISENLIQSLQPAKTFHGKDYLIDVKEQLRKLYRQSSALLKMERSNLDVTQSQKQSLKRKQDGIAPRTEVSKFKLFNNVQATSCSAAREPNQSVPCATNQVKACNWAKHVRHLPSAETSTLPESEAADIILLEPDVTEVQSFPQPSVMSTVYDNCNSSNRLTKCRRTYEQSDTNFLVRGIHSSTSKKMNEGGNHAYDLLDFLDHVGKSAEITLEPSAHSYLSPKISLSVSLPRKPSDNSPSPQQRFYPRKLYSDSD